MPVNITDSDAFTSPVVAPADTEAANSASIIQGLQPLANRTYHHDLLLKTNGVPRIRSGTAATMVALTGQTNGAMFVVTASGAPQGLYFYQAAGANPVDSVWVYTATGMGVGQWVHANYTMLNANLGFAAVGPVSGFSGVPANRISETFVPMRLVNLYFAQPTVSLDQTTSTTHVDIVGYTTTVADTEPNDLIICDFELINYMDAGSTVGYFAPTVVDGASTTQIGEVQFAAGLPYTVTPISHHGIYVVATGGTLTLKGRHKTFDGLNNAVADSARGSRIRALHFRP